MEKSETEIKRLICGTQNYQWGKIGPDSTIFNLLKQSGVTDLDKKLPYAEL